MATKDMVNKDAIAEANKFNLSEDSLSEMGTIEDAFAAFSDMGAVVDDAENYSVSWGPILENKDQLVGAEFLAVEWRFNKGTYGEFVTIYVMTRDNQKYILNDGSTGICGQMRAITDKRVMEGKNLPQTALHIRRGLRRSDYQTEVDGKTIDASTYYLAI